MATANKSTTKTTAPKKVSIAQLSVTEVQAELVTQRSQHLESRRSHRGGELVNPHILSTQRKTIARLLTRLNQAKKEEKN